jgi:hypothetical protein
MDKPIPKEILDRIVWNEKFNKHERRVEEFKPTCSICEDCGLSLDETRIVNCKRSGNQTAHPHFKSQCSVCKLYKHPETKKYDSTFYEVESHWRSIYKKAFFAAKRAARDK